MNTTEFVQHIIDEKQEGQISKNICEVSAYETAQLLSGSFTYPLYSAIWKEFYDLDSITAHLSCLYESENHYGLLYFIVLLADIVEYDIPLIFAEMSVNKNLVAILSAAIIEDWLEYHETSEVMEANEQYIHN